MNNLIVSVEWLNKNLNDPDLIILDCSKSSSNQVIKGSQYFDLKNNFSDLKSKLPNTFPSQDQFESNCKFLGVNKNSKIIVYDNQGIFFSPRVWFMFKAMSHDSVYVLDGGLPEWLLKGFDTEDSYFTDNDQGNFQAIFNQKKLKGYNFILKNLKTCQNIVIDARSEGRFLGVDPEPRKGLKSGHIPNSINAPYTSFLDNGKFKPKEDLFKIFESLNLSDSPLVFTCGSGITACIILLAAELSGINNHNSIYDGSWTEWATLQGLFS